MTFKWMATMFVGTMSSMAHGAPVIASIMYRPIADTQKGTAYIYVKNGAPFPKPAIKGLSFGLCTDKTIPSGGIKVYIGSDEITDASRDEESSTCITGRLPDKAMTGKIKLVTSAGSVTYPQPITIDFAPGQSRCQMAASAKAKWSDAQRSKLMVTLTFTNTGKYPCWVTPEDAAGKYFVDGALAWWTDGKCQRNFTGGQAYLPPDLPGRNKTPLPVGKTLTATFDAFTLPNYEKINCPGSPEPKKIFVQYRAGHNEVYVESPVFEMPW